MKALATLQRRCAAAAIAALAVSFGGAPQAQAVWPDKQFKVDAAGYIWPPVDFLHSGQTAVWSFATPSPANALVRQTSDRNNPVAAPFEPKYVNELMTPLPKGMSGIFVISPNQGGLVEQTKACQYPSEQAATRTVNSVLQYLCTTPNPTADEYQRTMDATWANPAVTGVFIRLKWSDLQTGPNTYDDTILLREVDKAVAHGKLYSIAIKSGAEGDATPTWLFDPAPAGAGLTPVTLDWNEDSASCNSRPHDYGNPADAGYRDRYLDMLSHVASVLKGNSARWRSLAYVKLSGANAHSAENRLPNGCKAGPGCICNNERWADAGYMPSGLQNFYEAQMERVARDFPGKSMSYSLIQDGFPRVNDERCYLNASNAKICPVGVNTRMVGPFEQTEAVIDHARSHYGDDVAIAHLGLGPRPDFSDPTLYALGTDCPLPMAPDGVTPAHGKHAVGSGCPNKWATDVGAVGGLTHFQTTHAPKVETPAQLASALDNLWSNSNAAMLEIYEVQAWQAGDAVLDPGAKAARTLAEWSEQLHERRRQAFPKLGDPAPRSISFTFTRSIDPRETIYYFVPKSGPRSTSPRDPLLGTIGLLY